MRKLKMYLDTSVWNFFFADDAPEKKEITLKFFGGAAHHDLYISPVVLQEVMQAPRQKATQLERLIGKHKPQMLLPDPEITRLARLYVARGIIPEKKFDDALHIAFCVYHAIDVLVSWNYKHLANVFKKKKVAIVNLEQGYDKPLEITTPLEVMHDEGE